MIDITGADRHREAVDVTARRRPRVLMVVANPATASTTGWPVGFWASELTHPYYAFRRVGYEIVVASPEGGRVEVDALSDPRDESGGSAEGLISMGFLSTPRLGGLRGGAPSL